ncbi:ATP-dependent helicase [Anaerobutyricum hallii]|uniref:DNA 3'-5' helicase n=1 Tax=Anaerobutyricum hallii TaxID=39488 RepID=A0A413Q1D1_9FIRM|nr:ATP-dependent helicase [Anaerobutyricum hallii]RGZ86360.1 ATP-dependent helicase [Anaerobutyricum hallii]
MPAIFNKEQEEAITHKEGPLMVLAGPGSGKTLVITYRVKWLIENAGVHPSNILVITFTRAAAEEMRKRFFAFDGMENAPVTFGTFHSIFFMILRYAYRYTAENIIREDVKRRYIKEMTENMELEIEDEKEFLSGIINEISYVKGEMMSLSYYHSSNCSDELFAQIYEGYERRLREENLIDFDDMLVFCYELLKERKDILAMWQQKFQYILIDEFQDINKVQYEIVRMLAGKGDHLFIVGDDDQSIYRFRGARPEIMLGFEKDYPDAKKVILNTNYRCSAEIVDSAEHLISHNTKRFPKNMQAARGKKVPITFRYLKDAGEECTDILKGIRFYHKKGIPLEEMAVIFRTNTQPRLLVGRLMEYNIPFQMRDVIPNIFDHWIARNILTYIKIAMGNKDRKLFLQIMNRPKRYISRSMLTDPQVDLKKLKQETFGKKWLYEKIDKLEMDLCLLRKMEPYAAIQYIRNGIGYEDYMNEYAQFRRMNPDDLEEVLNQIQESAKEYHSFEEWFSYIDSYGEELEKQMEAGRQQQKSGVTLTTMHSSKGLEYEVVFVMDINEGTTPHKKAVKDADLEEERRLFYVAVTRAKTYLFLYSLKELYQKDAQISRYIGELRYDKKEFKKGRRVVHKNIGKGTILELKDDKIKIRFDNSKKPRLFSIKYLMEQGLLELE